MALACFWAGAAAPRTSLRHIYRRRAISLLQNTPLSLWPPAQIIEALVNSGMDEKGVDAFAEKWNAMQTELSA